MLIQDRQKPPWLEGKSDFESQLQEAKALPDAVQKHLDCLIQNSSQYVPVNSELFHCPICGRGFPREASEWRHISKAHIWPEALGGKDWTVLCTLCNNEMGARIDSDFIYIVRNNYDFLSPDGVGAKQRFKLVNDDYSVLARIWKTDEVKGFRFEVIPGKQHPKIESAIMNLPSGGSLSITPEPSRIHRTSVDVGLASVAFLTLYKHFGYQFTFTPLGEALRMSIWYYDFPIALPTYFLDFSDLICPLVPFLWRSKSGEIGFGINIPDIRPDDSGRRTLLLPPLYSRDIESRIEPSHISVIPINSEAFELDNVGNFNALWRQLYGLEYKIMCS